MSNTDQPRRRPLRILASYLMDAPTASKDYSDELHELAGNAGRAVTNSGDDVQVIFVNALAPGQSAEKILHNIDGVLMLGGADVDPTLFTTDPEVIKHSVNTNPAADRFEIDLVKEAAKQSLPVFGICRGAQIINVAYGGTLITELGDGTEHRGPDGDEWSDHDVALAEESRLKTIYGQETVAIRSAHHQAVEHVAPGFKVTATAADGVVEAIEAADDRWIVAVQWHPEDTYGNKAHLDLLAAELVSEARKIYNTRIGN